MKEQLKKAEERMNRRLDHLCTEYAEIRAGRANPAVLDKVKVDYYGAPTPVNQLAAVSVTEARTLTIQPWDASILRQIEKAIQAANRTVGTDIYLVGVDALTEALEDVLAGTMTGTVFNDHIAQSHGAADAAINYITGAGNDYYIGCDYVKVTTDNAQSVLDSLK